MFARRNPFAGDQNEVVSAAIMTGTPSEPTSDKLDDDLAGTDAPHVQPEDSSSSSDSSSDTGEAEVAPRPRPRKRKKSSPPPAPGRPKILARVIAIAILVGIPVALLISSQRGGASRGAAGKLPASTGWAVGSEQSVDVTLVQHDRNALACASSEEIAGKHCQFEAQNKPWSKGGPGDDKVQYKPYRLAGSNDPVLIAGLWSQPALASGLPTDRFTAKCKLKVEGKIKKPAVRWHTADPWFDEPFDWPAGSVSNCTVAR